MWKSLYDYLTQQFAGLKWSAFLAQNNNNITRAAKLRDIFRNDLYPLSGMLVIVFSIIAGLTYYFVINKKGGAGYAFRVKYWVAALLLNAFTVTFIMLYITMKMSKPFNTLHPFKYCMSLATTNFMYAALLFFIFSIVIKRFSVANTTPF